MAIEETTSSDEILIPQEYNKILIEARECHGLPPWIADAVNEVAKITQAPIEIVIASAMSAASLACQSQVDVIAPHGKRHPCSLFFLTVGESGERKTTVDMYFTSPIFSFEKDKDKEYREHMNSYKISMAVWEEAYKNILLEVKKSDKSQESLKEIADKLTKLDLRKPEKPKRLKLIYADTTPEALALGLHENWPSAGIMSDEAGSVLNGHALKDLALLNRLWDGNDLTIDRKNSESFTVKEARLTISLMTQSKSFHKFIASRDGLARNIGFMARCFITNPLSTQGERIYNNLSVEGNLALDNFHAQIKNIIEINSTDNPPTNKTRTTYKLSSRAVYYWVSFFNEVETKIKLGGAYSEIKDAASKIAENCLRVAAIFHHFSPERNSEISSTTIIQAIEFCKKYIEQFNKFFGYFGEFTKDYKNLKRLINYLKKIEPAPAGHYTSILKNTLLQKGPIRDAPDLSKALEYLSKNEAITLFKSYTPNGTGKTTINLIAMHRFFYH